MDAAAARGIVDATRKPDSPPAIAADVDVPECAIFDTLTPPQRRELLALMSRETYGENAVILEEGKQTRGLWIITRGRCEVVRAIPDGGARVLAELGVGAIFGEMSFFQPAPHSATVRTVTPVEVLHLTTQSYAELERTGLRAAHKIAHAIAVTLAERLRRMDDWTSQLLSQAPSEKHEEWAEFRAKLYNNWF